MSIQLIPALYRSSLAASLCVEWDSQWVAEMHSRDMVAETLAPRACSRRAQLVLGMNK